MTLHLPQGYLSWSQLSLWEKSKKQYIDRYVYGKPAFETPEMRFGSAFAQAVEHYGEVSTEWDEIISRLPVRQYREAELRIEYKGVPLLAAFDSCDREGFEEYKTGRTPWDEIRVNEHRQLDFYCVAFMEEVGEKPEMQLHWLPTVKDENGIRLTGEIHTFHPFRSIMELEDYGKYIVKTAEEISMAVREVTRHQ